MHNRLKCEKQEKQKTHNGYKTSLAWLVTVKVSIHRGEKSRFIEEILMQIYTKVIPVPNCYDREREILKDLRKHFQLLLFCSMNRGLPLLFKVDFCAKA